MPVKECTIDNKPGYKWGDSGKCYTYTPNDDKSRGMAKNKAIRQGIAIGEYKSQDNKEKSFIDKIKEILSEIKLIGNTIH